MNFDNLPNELQDYVSSRFAAYGLDPSLAFEYLLPDEVKVQGWDAIENFMRHKHISHIYPQSIYPEMNGELHNVFLEDPSENLMRGDRIASVDELYRAEADNISDALDGDYDDDGIYDGFCFSSSF